LTVEVDNASTLHVQAVSAGINLGRRNGNTVGITLDETTTIEDVAKLVRLFTTNLPSIEQLTKTECAGGFPTFFERTSAFLTHPVFNS
jgi:glycine dehydrogenase